MAREVGAEKAKSTAAECDLCHERKGRNSAVVHILKFRDHDDLLAHLRAVFPDTPYCVDYFSTLWTNAHHYYGNQAFEKYAPLWLVYLEAHGVTVKNRAQAILDYRS